jgi:electron transfer flavoprotein beta subunit
MHTIVCIKQVLDTRGVIKVKDGRITQQEPELVKIPNPRDIAALEEAMHLKARFGGEITAISVGDEGVCNVLRHSLARGADRAIHVLSLGIDFFSTYRLIGQVVSGLRYDVILCGDRSSNEGRGCVGSYLAHFLDVPHATRVVGVELDPEQNRAIIWRQLERGWREEMECRLPAVFGIERTSYEQSYVSVFSREAASKKPLTRVEPKSLEEREPFEACLQVVEVTPPRPRTKKTFVPDASLPPEERFKLLMSGGAEPKKESDFIEGQPEQVARAVVDFLKKEGLIDTSGERTSSDASK